MIPARSAEAIAARAAPSSTTRRARARGPRRRQSGRAARARAARAVGGERGELVHRGATSQDIIDTAAMLVARRTRSRSIAAELDGAAAACAGLARDAPRDADGRAGRCSSRPCRRRSGCRAAGWLVGAARRARRGSARSRAAGAARRRGGHARGARRRRASRSRALFAAGARARRAAAPWHTHRDAGRRARRGARGSRPACSGRSALDVVLLAQTEVGEVREARTAGGSSTMPHKRNPVGAMLARACARHVHGARARCSLPASRRARARGGRLARRVGRRSRARSRYTGGAAAAIARRLDGLEVDAERMRANIAADDAARGGARGSASTLGPGGLPRRSRRRSSTARSRATRTTGDRAMSDERGMKMRREVLGDEHVDRAIERHDRRSPPTSRT